MVIFGLRIPNFMLAIRFHLVSIYTYDHFPSRGRWGMVSVSAEADTFEELVPLLDLGAGVAPVLLRKVGGLLFLIGNFSRT